MLKAKKGFTLIELLIVIIILAILIAIVVGVAFQSNRNKAYDIDKKSDLATIQKKLEEYNVDNSSYPNALTQLTSGTDPYLQALPTNQANSTIVYQPLNDSGANDSSCNGTSTTPCAGYRMEIELSNDKDNGAGTAACTLTGLTGRCYYVTSNQ